MHTACYVRPWGLNDSEALRTGVPVGFMLRPRLCLPANFHAICDARTMYLCDACQPGRGQASIGENVFDSVDGCMAPFCCMFHLFLQPQSAVTIVRA
jgi:hypothetical protein